jgi:4-hydroxybenzoyl-CoA thioesterase
MSKTFEARFRIYYEDTDAGGVVYHPNYLNFMARTRSEWLRTIPHFFEDLRAQKILTPVKSVEIDYHAPAFLGDEILVRIHLKTFKPVSAVFSHEIYRYNTNELLCTATIKLACVSENLELCRWPDYDKMRELLK